MYAWIRGVGLVLLAASVLVAVAAGAPPGTITEFTAGLNPGANPAQVQPGPDGNLWFTDRSGAIGEVTTSGLISEFSSGLNPGSMPFSITTGPDGNLWFTDQGTTSAIGIINPTTHAITEFSTGLNVSSKPYGIALGPDGNLWFTDDSSGTPAIGVINAATHAIAEFSSGLNPGSSPQQGIAAGPDGNVWFTDLGTTKAIGRINPTTHAITEFSSGLNPGSAPGAAIAVGTDGNLWFVDHGTTGAIGRITTTGAISEFSSGLHPGSIPGRITSGPDGNLWFTDKGPTPAIGTINPTTDAISEFSAGLNAGSLPGGIGVGADGNIWFTDQGTTRAIGRFTLAVCGTSLVGCNFQDANLANLVVNGASLDGSNLQGAQLQNAHLIGANLEGTNLQGAQLQSYAFLDGANLTGDNLAGANLSGADLTGASLVGANLQGANLAGTNLSNVDLTGANLQGASLRGANLTGANLTGANLAGADLTGANLTDTTFTGANLGGQRFLRRVAVIGLPAPYAPLTSFDIGWVDPVTQGYYLADHSNTGVDAVDGTTDTFGSVIGAGMFSPGGNAESPDQIAACGRGNAGPNGVLTLNVGGVNQLWASDGVSADNPVSNVKVFTLTTPTSGTLAATIPTAVAANGTKGICRADELAYDPVDRLLLVANDRAPDSYVSFISVNANPALDAVVGQIKLPEAVNGIEQPVYNPETGLFYLNVPGVELAVIDPAALTLKTTYPTPGCSASGLALDEQTQQLLLSCSVNPGGVAFMDAGTGTITTRIAEVSGADEVWFDPGMRTYYLAASSMTQTSQPGGTVTPVLGAIAAGQTAGAEQWLTNAPTGAGAHSVAANPVNGQVFVPIGGLGGIAVYAWTS